MMFEMKEIAKSLIASRFLRAIGLKTYEFGSCGCLFELRVAVKSAAAAAGVA